MTKYLSYLLIGIWAAFGMILASALAILPMYLAATRSDWWLLVYALVIIPPLHEAGRHVYEDLLELGK